MAIQILLKDIRTDEQKTFWFEQSPIRIGRNQLNNVAIDDHYVSEWHGIIRFDATGVYYFDLGSTNGTSLDGQRLIKNTITPLSAGSSLTIWPYQIFATVQVAPLATGNSTGTLVWGAPQANTGASRIASPAAGVRSERGSGEWTDNRAPEASPPMRQPAPPPSATNEKERIQQARIVRLLETFTETFIGLKKGYEEFGAEVGVRPLSGDTPLHRARTSREVMSYLLDPTADVEDRARDLRAVFADMGIHHIALMEGLAQGIRSLLESLDPSAQEVGSSLFTRGKSKAEWNSYVERFATLITEDAVLHAEIFGEAFARGYASVALGELQLDRKREP